MPDAHDGAQPIGPAGGVLGIDPDAVLTHLVAADVGVGRAFDSLGQGHVDVVEAALHPDARLAVEVSEPALEGVMAMEAEDRALVALAELVADRVGRVIEEIGEVVVERQRAVDRVGLELAQTERVALAQPRRQAVAAGIAAVGRIERAPAADEALLDGALRDLIGRRPAVLVGHAGDRDAVVGRAVGCNGERRSTFSSGRARPTGRHRPSLPPPPAGCRSRNCRTPVG